MKTNFLEKLWRGSFLISFCVKSFRIKNIHALVVLGVD
jgi:hypothetical protein